MAPVGFDFPPTHHFSCASENPAFEDSNRQDESSEYNSRTGVTRPTEPALILMSSVVQGAKLSVK